MESDLLGVQGIILAYLGIGLGLIGTAWSAGTTVTTMRRRIAQYSFMTAGFLFVGLSLYLFLYLKLS